jgi:cell division septum initiation protein DivIVA
MASVNVKKLWSEVESLRNQLRNGQGSFYDLATRCVVLFNACGDCAKMLGITEDETHERIAGLFDDFAIDLSEAIVVLKFFPQREHWNKPVRELYADARVQAQRMQPTNGGEKRSVHRVTRKEFEAVEQRAVDAEHALTRETSRIDQLLAENRELREENARLKGRIEQLERQLSGARQPAYAGSGAGDR